MRNLEGLPDVETSHVKVDIIGGSDGDSCLHVYTLAGDTVLEVHQSKSEMLTIGEVKEMIGEKRGLSVERLEIVLSVDPLPDVMVLQSIWQPHENLELQVLISPEVAKESPVEGASIPAQASRENCLRQCFTAFMACIGYVSIGVASACCGIWPDKENDEYEKWYGPGAPTRALWLILNRAKCIGDDTKPVLILLPSICCCVCIPFGIIVGLGAAEVISKTVAFVIFFSAAGLTCLCWPAFGIFTSTLNEEIQGEYAVGSAVEGCYVSTGMIWCCVVIFSAAILIVLLSIS